MQLTTFEIIKMKCFIFFYYSYIFQIETIDNLAPLKIFEITELILDKNPICDSYDNIFTYVKNIEQYCPKISVLVGFLLY